MAKQVIHMLIDDLDGESEATGTVRFALDGTSYEIDLTDDHQAQLREAIRPYCESGLRLGRVTQTGERVARTVPKSYELEQRRVRLDQIRGWFARLPEAARRAIHPKGYDELADRGRIPEGIVQAYEDPAVLAARVKVAESAAKRAGKPVEAPKAEAPMAGEPKGAVAVSDPFKLNPARKRTGKAAAPQATTVEAASTVPAKRVTRRTSKAEANSTK